MRRGLLISFQGFFLLLATSALAALCAGVITALLPFPY